MSVRIPFWFGECGGRGFANVGNSVSFILTGLLIWREDRANRVGGGVSYA